MANDNWRTPPKIFEHYNKEYKFAADVCASDDNALCDRYITEEQNYLLLDNLFYAHVGEYVWINPPYSKPLPFVQKAINDSIHNGIGCVMLLNHDMTTKWARLLQSVFCYHHVFNRRIAFLNDKGEPVAGNNKGQFIAIIPPFTIERDPIVKYVHLDDYFDSEVSA